MKYTFKSYLLGTVIAVSTALTGCDSDEEQAEITDVFTDVGLWCKSPTVVEIASADFYPLSDVELEKLEASKADVKAQAEIDAGGSWTDEAAAEWEASFEYDDLDLYSILGLTLEEQTRQATAKEEARVFKVEQGQDVIYGDDFDDWFDDWFAAIPPVNYLGASQRINKSVNATTPDMDGEEICYNPPLSCPNYKVIDETGTYECIIPEINPIMGVPNPVVTAGTDETVVFYRHEDHVAGADNSALYENIVVHTWNSDECSVYEADSIASWGANSTYANDNKGIDDYYGQYWKLHLLAAAEQVGDCANVIFNDTDASEKKISDSDLTIPLGSTGDVVLHNLDFNAFVHDDFSANVLDGMLLMNQHPYLGAESSSSLKTCGWGMAADDSGELCLGETLECPMDTVAVGVGAVDIASKCVVLFKPEETTLFIKGGFNDWSDTDDAKFTYIGDGQYQLNYLYESDCMVVEPTDDTEGEDCSVTHSFKVADEAGSEPASFGSIEGGEQSAVGSTITMTVGSGVGQDMSVDMEEGKIYQFLVDAKDTAAVQLTINEVPADVFPMLTIGTEIFVLAYSSDGNYGVRADLAADSHSLTISDDSTGFAVGAIGSDNLLVENTPLALENDGSALSFTSDAGEYDFTLNMSNPDAPTIEVQSALPWGADVIYIRGSINGWSSPDEDKMVWDADSRTYRVIYGLEADGTHEFKFADAGWGVEYGGGQVNYSDEGIDLSGSANISVSVPTSSSYLFAVSFDDEGKEVVKVTAAPLYLPGSITTTGWSFSDGNQLAFIPADEANTAEASHIYSLEVDYIGGEEQFKVADAGWGGSFGYDFGAADSDNVNIVLGVAMPLTKGGANLVINEVSGTYIFTFDDANKTMTVTAK